MNAPAILPRRRATLQALKPMRPEAPTLPVADPARLAYASTVAFEGDLSRLEQQAEEPEEVTQLRGRDPTAVDFAELVHFVEEDDDEPPTAVAPHPPSSGAKLTPRVRMQLDSGASLREAEPTEPRREAEPLASMRETLDAPVDTVRLDTSGARPIVRQAETAKLDNRDYALEKKVDHLPELEKSALRPRAEDMTRVGTPRLPAAAMARPISAAVRVQTPPPGMHVAPGVLPSVIVAGPLGAAFAPTVPAGMPIVPTPPAEGSVHVTPATARKTPAARPRSRAATFLCGTIAAAMAVVALAESPLGNRPELAPYARVVRQEARSAAVGVRRAAVAAYAEIRALAKP